MIPFGNWQPDLYSFDSPYAGEALGVRPWLDSYQPLPQLAVYSAALAAAGRGGCVVNNPSGGYSVFAGTATKLYKLSGTSWTDVSRSSAVNYACAADERWRFAKFGANLIAVNRADDPQFIAINAGTNFEPLTGSPPKGRTVATIGDFLMLGGTDTTFGLAWSGLNNISQWTVGTNSSDIQAFPEGGEVFGIASLGDQLGLIFQENAIRRITFQPDSPFVFRFDKIEDDRGLVGPDSLVVRGAKSFFLSQDGFYVADASGVVPIGKDAVDDWFYDHVELNRVYTTQGVADPVKPYIYWLFPTSGNTNNVLDHLLVFNYLNRRWAHAAVSLSSIFAAATSGYTLEDLDAFGSIDDLTFSFDARFLTGGIPTLAGLDSSNKLSFFSGDPMAGVVETGSFRPIPGERAVGKGITPLTDCSDLTAEVSAVETAQATENWSAASSMNRIGVCPVRVSGAVHRIRINTAVSAEWTHLRGVEYDAVPEGIA